MPYGIQTAFLPIYFRKNGTSLFILGFYRLVLIPNILKPLLVTIVEACFSKHGWLSGNFIVLFLLSLLISQLSPSYPVLLATVFFVVNTIAAIQDIALDSILLEFLPPSELQHGNMIQIVGFKLGSLFLGGIFILFIDYLTWRYCFLFLALLYFLGYIISEFYLSTFIPVEMRTSQQSQTTLSTSSTIHSSVDLVRRSSRVSLAEVFEVDSTAWMLLYLLIYKTGEQGASLLYPLFLIDSGYGVQEVGFWTTVSSLFSVIGSASGGIISRPNSNRSLMKAVRYMVFVRAVLVTLLWLVVLSNFDAFPYGFGLLVLTLVNVVGGAMTTSSLTLIMLLSQKCPRTYRTMYYNVLVTIENLGRLLLSSCFGAAVYYYGYSVVFGISSALTFIVMPLVLYSPAGLDIHE
ncbi:major facilitator superfamily domain-containing protein 3-like isoform X2 [Physella acuta]|nr:major facilitator superfamily domain-containing protein 3-like isoform X2 [Physella acuta]